MRLRYSRQMRVLFVVPELSYADPLGVMQLSALCKRDGHQTRLSVLARQPISAALREFEPDVVGYSVMTANKEPFAKADSTKGTAVPGHRWRLFCELAPRGRHARGHAHGLFHAARIGLVLSGNVEGRPVVHRGPDDRNSE